MTPDPGIVQNGFGKEKQTKSSLHSAVSRSITLDKPGQDTDARRVKVIFTFKRIPTVLIFLNEQELT